MTSKPTEDSSMGFRLVQDESKCTCMLRVYVRTYIHVHVSLRYARLNYVLRKLLHSLANLDL